MSDEFQKSIIIYSFPLIGLASALLTIKPTDTQFDIVLHGIGGVASGVFIIPLYPVIVPISCGYYLYRSFYNL